jgi:hypothetical protein
MMMLSPDHHHNARSNMNGILPTKKSDIKSLLSRLADAFHYDYAFVPSADELESALLILNNMDGLSNSIEFLQRVAKLAQEDK